MNNTTNTETATNDTKPATSFLRPERKTVRVPVLSMSAMVFGEVK